MLELITSLTLCFIMLSILKTLYLLFEEYILMNRNYKEQHACLKQRLKELYGVNVIAGVPRWNLPFSDKDYSLNWHVSSMDCVKIDLALLEALGRYSDYALKQIPKEYYIVRDIYNSKTGTTTCGEYVHDDDCIVINASACDDDLLNTIHHELAHALTKNWDAEILSYQAEHDNIREEIADNWAYGFEHNDNDQANYLHTRYQYWLK